MLIREFRITMPLTVEEYQIGQLYSEADASILETGGGEGVQILENKPFKKTPLLGGQYSEGQYTLKKYHLASKIPTFVRMLTAKGFVELQEETWNAYPYIRTVVTNPGFMNDRASITVESLHFPDKGEQENVFGLPAETLPKRQVVMIDIANDLVQSKDYKEAQDPSKFQASKVLRGPLVGKWQETADPVMTCYKLVTVEFKWLGLQTRVESFMMKAQRRIFLNFHRLVFCGIDKWLDLDMEAIREMENEVRDRLDELRNKGEVRGMKEAAD